MEGSGSIADKATELVKPASREYPLVVALLVVVVVLQGSDMYLVHERHIDTNKMIVDMDKSRKEALAPIILECIKGRNNSDSGTDRGRASDHFSWLEQAAPGAELQRVQ